MSDNFNSALLAYYLVANSLENRFRDFSEFEVTILESKEEKRKVQEERPQKPLEKEKPRVTMTFNSQKDYNDIKNFLSKFLSNDKDASLTPNTLKKEFFHCSDCKGASLQKVLGEGDLTDSLVFVLTDRLLAEGDERNYLDKVLSSIRLEIGKNAYLTSVVKCKEVSDAEGKEKCKKFAIKQALLTNAKCFIAFGDEAKAVLKELKEKDSLKDRAFIYSEALSTLQTSKEAKARLWNSFKKLQVFLNLPRV